MEPKSIPRPEDFDEDFKKIRAEFSRLNDLSSDHWKESIPELSSDNWKERIAESLEILCKYYKETSPEFYSGSCALADTACGQSASEMRKSARPATEKETSDESVSPSVFMANLHM